MKNEELNSYMATTKKMQGVVHARDEDHAREIMRKKHGAKGDITLRKKGPVSKTQREANEGAMKRIATSQSSKPDRMAPGKGLDTFKKKPPEKNEVLDTDKARKSYMDKARYSKDRATNSAVANIMRKTDHSKDLKTRAKRVKGMDRVKNKAIMKFREM